MKLKTIAAGILALTAIGASAQNVNGAGATFPYPIYSKWFSEYSQQHPNVKINYQSIGSGGGIRQVSEGTVDFGATDGPMSDAQISAAKVKTTHIPTVLGAVVPIYNLPGVNKELNFSGDVIADIYLGKITTWNDPRIAKDNPGVNLPSNAILPVYRSDGSGTTYILTDYLSKVSSDWNSKVGKNTSVNWPTGLGGNKNEGVAGLVKQTPNAIGYVELIYAIQNKMAYGKVKNSSGQFVKADLASVTAAAAGASKDMPEDFRVSITNAPGKTAYPISSFTWLLIPSKFTDASKRDAIKGFVKWMLADGQNQTEALAYSKLPKEVVSMELKALDKVQ